MVRLNMAPRIIETTVSPNNQFTIVQRLPPILDLSAHASRADRACPGFGE
jgi:hypothetical protein